MHTSSVSFSKLTRLWFFWWVAVGIMTLVYISFSSVIEQTDPSRIRLANGSWRLDFSVSFCKFIQWQLDPWNMSPFSFVPLNELIHLLFLRPTAVGNMTFASDLFLFIVGKTDPLSIRSVSGSCGLYSCIYYLLWHWSYRNGSHNTFFISSLSLSKRIFLWFFWSMIVGAWTLTSSSSLTLNNRIRWRWV